VNIQWGALKDGRRVAKMWFQLPKDPATGKRRQVKESLTQIDGKPITEREAERYWRKKQAEYDAKGAGYVAPTKETLAEYLPRALRDYAAERSLKATTVATHETLLRKHIIPALGAVPLKDLTVAQVAAWQADMLRKVSRRGKAPQAGRPGQEAKAEKPPVTLSPKRVLNARMTLHTLLQEAVRHELIPSNPVDKVRPPKQNPEKVQPFATEHMQALAVAAQGHRLEALFATAWHTGMRMGELLALRWEDIDFKAATLRIARTAATTGGPVFFQDAKTAASVRTIALSPKTVTLLRAHRARQAEERLAGGAAWKDSQLVFPTSKGTAIQPAALERTWYSVRNKAGIPTFGFHSLRHTYACLALSAGVPLELVSENLGHRSPAFTKRVYAEYMLDAKRAGADVMTGVIAKAEGH
jgi:integrase